MLDLDPEVLTPPHCSFAARPIDCRKESHSQILNKTNWDLLAARYQQLLDYNKAYDGGSSWRWRRA